MPPVVKIISNAHSGKLEAYQIRNNPSDDPQKLAGEKRDLGHFSLLQKSVHCGHKKVYSTGPWGQWFKQSMAVIYSCSQII